MPAVDWHRPKELPSQTLHIETSSCGTLHLTICTESNKVIEVRSLIGRNQTCGNILLDSFAKVLSCYLQSTEPRYKIVRKLRKQFLPDTKGNSIQCSGGQKSCIESIVEKIIDHIE